jgi:phosphoribosyl 1,2-cyclic phosphodiesterase
MTVLCGNCSTINPRWDGRRYYANPINRDHGKTMKHFQKHLEARIVILFHASNYTVPSKKEQRGKCEKEDKERDDLDISESSQRVKRSAT